MTTATLPIGRLPEMADTDYYALDGLSQSGAKVLLDQCPRLFRWQQDNPVHDRKYDEGHVLHSLVLGSGSDVEVLPTDVTDWRTKKAQEIREQAEKAGKIAMLAKDHERLREVAASIRTDPYVDGLLDLDRGDTEVALSWEMDGVQWHGRLDYLRHDGAVIGDLKSSRNANPLKFRKSCEDFGYFQQAAAYTDAVLALDLGDPKFYFAVVETKPPFLTSVVALHPDDIERGRLANRRASLLYRRCVDSGQWPGYGYMTIEASGFWRTLQDGYESGAPVTDLHDDEGDDDDDQ